jgi:hypothetical protein
MTKIYVLFLRTARNHRLLAFLLPKAAKGTKNALSARFNARPVAGSMAKRAELASKDAQTGTPLYAIFT